MNLYCSKCQDFTKINIKMKSEIDGKINLYSHRIDCGSEKFETIDKEN